MATPCDDSVVGGVWRISEQAEQLDASIVQVMTIHPRAQMPVDAQTIIAAWSYWRWKRAGDEKAAVAHLESGALTWDLYWKPMLGGLYRELLAPCFEQMLTREEGHRRRLTMYLDGGRGSKPGEDGGVEFLSIRQDGADQFLISFGHGGPETRTGLAMFRADSGTEYALPSPSVLLVHGFLHREPTPAKAAV